MTSSAEAPDLGLPATPRPIGPSLGRYALRHRIAEGGMGAVYLAQLVADASFTKWVAVKVVHPSLATDTSFVTMFKDEARIAAMLTHPNVAQVFDFGSERDVLYLAMEYLHGESLGAVAREAWRHGGISPLFAARVVADAARGLHAAHELRLPDGRPAGVVHRDVSPQNVFVLYEGVSKIVDFGIAKSNDRLSERTATDVVKGKIAYLAPEQLKREPLDRRADVFALGIVLWEISVGRRLFKADNEAATMFMIANGEVAPPSSIRPGYPPALERIVLRALSRDREQRYQTGAEMARELERFIADSGAPFGAPEVAEVMQTLFANEMRERDRLLSTIGTSGNEPTQGTAQSDSLSFGSGLHARNPPPASEPVATPAQLERTVLNSSVGAVVDRMSVPSAMIAQPQNTSRRMAIAGVAVVLVAAVATLAVVLHPWRHQTSPTQHAIAPPVVTPAVIREPVLIEISTTPPGAALLVDGTAVANPYVVQRLPSTQTHRVEAVLHGYVSTEREVTFEAPLHLAIALRADDTIAHEPAAPTAPATAPTTPHATPRTNHHDTTHGAGLGTFTNY